MKKLRSVRQALPNRHVLALALVAILAPGCGQQTPNNVGTTATVAATSTAGAPTGSLTTGSNGSPNYDFHFQITGSSNAEQVGGGSLEVSTDTVLSLSLTAGTFLQINGASGYQSSAYNCQAFTIKVGNVVQQAFVKKTNYTDIYASDWQDPCANAPTTWTGDFSAALGPSHGPVSITINNAQYDNCRVYTYNGAVYSDPTDGGCPLSSLYSTHTMDGFLAVTTD